MSTDGILCLSAWGVARLWFAASIPVALVVGPLLRDKQPPAAPTDLRRRQLDTFIDDNEVRS